MDLIRSWNNGVTFSRPSAVCIGVFDGLHLGHQALINRVLSLADGGDLSSMMLTFEPSPRHYFSKQSGQSPWPRLMRFSDKYACLKQWGLDALCALRFNGEFSALSGSEFSSHILKAVLNARHVVVGNDFRFGRGRKSGVADLIQFGLRDGFEVQVIEPVCLPGKGRCSSTVLREALKAGDFSYVERLLDRPYTISGTVRPGDGRGRQIGVPTANIHIPPNALPLEGVYAVTVDTPVENSMPAVANIGPQPTFNGEKKRLEVHVFDFDRQAYNERWTVSVKHRIRGVQKFDGIEQLIAQISKDQEIARAFFQP